MLKGQAKRDYQREYMRKKRAKGSNKQAKSEGSNSEGFAHSCAGGPCDCPQPNPFGSNMVDYVRAPVSFPKYNYSSDWKRASDS